VEIYIFLFFRNNNFNAYLGINFSISLNSLHFVFDLILILFVFNDNKYTVGYSNLIGVTSNKREFRITACSNILLYINNNKYLIGK